MERWTDSSAPCIDPISVNPAHMGEFNIPPFQTWNRYYYAGLGEACCGQHFVYLFYQQFHPFPHCDDCASIVLQAASAVCWCVVPTSVGMVQAT